MKGKTLLILGILSHLLFGKMYAKEPYRPDSAKYQVILPINLLGAFSLGGGYFLNSKNKIQSNLYVYRGFPNVTFTKKNFSMDEPDGEFNGFGLKAGMQHNLFLKSYDGGCFLFGAGLGFWKRNLQYNKSTIELNFGQEYKTVQHDIFYDLTYHVQSGMNFFIKGHFTTAVYLDLGYLQRFGNKENEWTHLSPIPVLGITNTKNFFASVQVELAWNFGRK